MPYPLYDGIRLFLWTLPYFCIIPGIVIYYLIENFKNKKSENQTKIMLNPNPGSEKFRSRSEKNTVHMGAGAKMGEPFHQS